MKKMTDISVIDNRIEDLSLKSIANGDIIKIEANNGWMSIYLDTGYMISIDQKKIIEFLMLDKLEKSK